MALKSIGDDVFQSLTAAWPPAPFQRAFGGHVYAQAMYAASRTVEKGLVLHVRFAPRTKCPVHELLLQWIFLTGRSSQ